MTPGPTRRAVVATAASSLATTSWSRPLASADLILTNAKVTTLDRSNPQAQAVAIRDGRFLAVGSEAEVRAAAAPDATVIDAKGRRVIPGLIDSHMHIIRGGLNYNMELRWDGVPSRADAMAMLKTQVAITPPNQWVRVVGGFTEHQFTETARDRRSGAARGRGPSPPGRRRSGFSAHSDGHSPRRPGGHAVTRTELVLPLVLADGLSLAGTLACALVSSRPAPS